MSQDPSYEPTPLPIGNRVEPVDDVFEHYRIFRREDGSLWELGHGSMGVTYKAVDTNLDAVVALKIINAQFLGKESSRQRFRREARAAASLRHRNVSSVYHLGQSGQSFFYAMEYVDGATIEALVKRDGPFPWRRALSVTLQITRALMAAHAKNLVHRDIKPLNVMVVDEVDETDVAKLIDFGLAKSAVEEEGGEGVTNASGFLGTPLYSSPEQCEEMPADIRSDIYSLGITLWYMLTGHPTFEGNLARVFQQQLHAEPPWDKLPAGLPPAVRTLLESMLAKERANRPQSPADLRAEIENCLQAPSTEVPAFVLPPPKPSIGEEEKPKLVVQTKPLVDRRDPLQLAKKNRPPEKQPPDGPPPLVLPGGNDGPPPLPPIPPEPKPWYLTPKGISIVVGALAGVLLLILAVRAAVRPHGKEERKETDPVAIETPRPTPTPTTVPARTPPPPMLTPPPVSSTSTKAIADAFRLSPLLTRARELSKTEQWEPAAAAWDAVLEIVPQSMEGHVERGTAHNFLARYDKARGDFNLAALLLANDARESLYEGIAHMRLERDADARRCFEAGTKLVPQDARDHYLLAYAYQRGNEAEAQRAIDEYSEAIRLDPQDVRSWNNRGAGYNGQGKYDLAIKDFEAALSINPKAWLVLYARGNSYSSLGQYQRALQDYDAALAINPYDVTTCNQRGLAYNELGQYQRAIQDFDAVIKQNPKMWLAYSNRGYSYGCLEQYPRALQDLDEAIRLNPKAALAFYYRGLVFNEQKQYDRAIKEFDEAIRLYPKNALYFYHRANSYLELKQALRAVTDYNEAIRLNPKASAAFNNRGNAYDSLNKSQQALADYSEAIRLNPKNAVALYNRGNENVKIGQAERSLVDFDEAIRLDPKNTQMLNRRGYAYVKLKRYPQAVDDATQAIKLDPKNADAYLIRAAAQEALGRTEAAGHDRDKAKLLGQGR